MDLEIKGIIELLAKVLEEGRTKAGKLFNVKIKFKGYFFLFLLPQPQTQTITVSCWWLEDITRPSRSSPRPSPTTSCWARCWNTCAASTRATRRAPACCSKVTQPGVDRSSIWTHSNLSLLFSLVMFCSHRAAFSRHEPPLTFGGERRVQHHQTPAQPCLRWAAERRQFLAVSTGNHVNHKTTADPSDVLK